ncbi:MAG: hypothetical protein AAGF11_42950 [Myxococcota bacterium]
MTERSPRTWYSWAPVVIATAAALLMLVPGLGDHGIWSEAELPVLDRARAALGASLSDLERNPWLPDLLRTRSYATLEGAVGLRLPHALAAVALVAMTGAAARMRGATFGQALLASGFALAFPMTLVAGRTALGNPVGEALAVGTVLAGLGALGAPSRARAVLWAGISAGLWSLSIAAAGLAVGGVIPLGALAAASLPSDRSIIPGSAPGSAPRSAPRSAPGSAPHSIVSSGSRSIPWIALSLWALLLATIATTVILSLDQQDGYIPLLGDSKDLLLVDKPENRRFAAGLEDLGYGLFPWAPLVIAGALLGRNDRLPALWLGVGVAVTGGWGLVYGPGPVPVTVPAALCALAAVRWILHPDTDRVGRRLTLAVVVLGMLVIGKDATASPARVAVPIFDFEREHSFPSEPLAATEHLGRIGAIALWALLLAGVLAPPGGRPHRLDRVLARLSADRRHALALGLVGAAPLWGATRYARTLVPQTCDLLSPRQLLEHHAALAQSGALPAQLGNHRVRDTGLLQYGPGDVVMLSSRRELTHYLSADEPRVAIIRDRDLPAIHQDHRQKGWPLYVLDDRHMHLRLVANRLPQGERDLNPIPAVVFDEPPPLAHPTQLQFENYIEIIGWEITDPVIRGRDATIQLAIRVLRPLPGGSKLNARLSKGRSSRLNSEPHELTDGIYPPNLWREGDFIRHAFTFKAPTLEIQPGEHELIVGLRRSERKNFEISVPEGPTGEYGVRVRGKKRSFATIGTVTVW